MGTPGRYEYSVHFWIFCANLCTLWDIPQYIGNDNRLLIISFPIYKMTMRKSPWDVWGWDLHSWSFFCCEKNKQKTCFSTLCWLFLSGPCNNIIDLLDTGDHKSIGRDMIAGQIIFFFLVFLFRFDLRLWKCGQNLILINTHHHGESLDEGTSVHGNPKCTIFPFPEWK